MEIRIYKSLDNPPSMLGLKGSYLRFAAIGLAIALVIGMLVGSVTNGLIGILVFVALTAAAYIGVMAFQARFTERERKKWFSSRKIPDLIHVKPVPIHKLARLNEKSPAGQDET